MEGQYLFCTISPERRRSLSVKPLLEFHEAEGVTLVLRKEDADKEAIDGQFLSRMIRLNISPTTGAVGLLAAVATRLAAHGVSIQPVAAFHHSYVFVPTTRADECVTLLQTLASEYRARKMGGSEAHPMM
jgi:hypothetical protein